jgi:hypothetical protein
MPEHREQLQILAALPKKPIPKKPIPKKQIRKERAGLWPAPVSFAAQPPISERVKTITRISAHLLIKLFNISFFLLFYSANLTGYSLCITSTEQDGQGMNNNTFPDNQAVDCYSQYDARY